MAVTVTKQEVLDKIAQLATIKSSITNSLSAKGINMTNVPFTQFHTKLTGGVKWIYGNGSAGNVTYSANASVGHVQARTITVSSGVKLTPTARLTPMILRATQSITIEADAELNADGYGYTYAEAGNNKFGLAVSSQAAAGSVGISGGGGKASGGSSGTFSPGGRAVAVSTFLAYLKAHYKELLADGNLDIIPLFGGGGAAVGDNPSYCRGGGCILLVAPVINFSGIGRVRGLPGQGANWGGHGGGGGGLFGMFSRTLNLGRGYTLDACGGGGGGGSWGGVGNDGSWQNGGASTGSGYFMGAGGGGSTALNADGGTPGTGGYGNQGSNWNPGSTNGTGGGGGNNTGSDRGGGGGAGGGAGKISWLQV